MRKEMIFYNLVGFYQNRHNLKNMYLELDLEDRKIYKMYVYSLPFMDDNSKDLIWEYLNGFDDSRKDLKIKYYKAKAKLDRRKKEVQIENNDDEYN